MMQHEIVAFLKVYQGAQFQHRALILPFLQYIHFISKYDFFKGNKGKALNSEFGALTSPLGC